MKKICDECKAVFSSAEANCPECMSDDYTTVNDEDICPVCGFWHDTGVLGSYKRELKECFDKVYRDGLAWKYIHQNWDRDEIDSNIEWLNEPFTDRTFKEMIWTLDTDEIKAFIQFAADCEQSARTENERIYAILPQRTGATV